MAEDDRAKGRTTFWDDAQDGAAVTFADWHTGEPNNFGPPEHGDSFGFDASSRNGWNDLSIVGGIGLSWVSGYLVEFPVPEPGASALATIGPFGIVRRAKRAIVPNHCDATRLRQRRPAHWTSNRRALPEIGVAAVNSTETGRATFEANREALTGYASHMVASFQAVGDALAAGDLGLAVRVSWFTMQAEFARGASQRVAIGSRNPAHNKADGEGFEQLRNTREKRGSQMKVAQNAAHLLRGKPNSTPDWRPWSMRGRHCRRRSRRASWR